MCKDVLKHSFGKTKKFPTDAIALPKNAVLTERENKLIVASIYEDSFEYFIEVQSFRWHMLKMPVELPTINVYGDGGIRIKTVIEYGHMT